MPHGWHSTEHGAGGGWVGGGARNDKDTAGVRGLRSLLPFLGVRPPPPVVWRLQLQWRWFPIPEPGLFRQGCPFGTRYFFSFFFFQRRTAGGWRRQDSFTRRRLTLNRRRLATDAAWPMPNRSHSPTGALRRFQCTGGRRGFFLLKSSGQPCVQEAKWPLWALWNKAARRSLRAHSLSVGWRSWIIQRGHHAGQCWVCQLGVPRVHHSKFVTDLPTNPVVGTTHRPPLAPQGRWPVQHWQSDASPRCRNPLGNAPHRSGQQCPPSTSSLGFNPHISTAVNI